ncbi:MAG: hypothetical protein GYB64_18040 [Chloroflexi bacterium]|nr:hypothetical protein [Chloroflexota bacterium]
MQERTTRDWINAGLIIAAVVTISLVVRRAGLSGMVSAALWILAFLAVPILAIYWLITRGHIYVQTRYEDISGEGLRPIDETAVAHHEALRALGFRRFGEYRITPPQKPAYTGFTLLDAGHRVQANLHTLGEQTYIHFSTIFGEDAVLETLLTPVPHARTIVNNPRYTQHLLEGVSVEAAYQHHLANLPAHIKRHGPIRQRPTDFAENLHFGAALMRRYRGPTQMLRHIDSPMAAYIGSWLALLLGVAVTFADVDLLAAQLHLTCAQVRTLYGVLWPTLFALAPLPFPLAPAVRKVIFRAAMLGCAVLALLPVGPVAQLFVPIAAGLVFFYGVVALVTEPLERARQPTT